jgi:hypothetical protein
MSFKDGFVGPSYQLMFKVNNIVKTNTYVVDTLDMLLGIIGGFAALVW